MSDRPPRPAAADPGGRRIPLRRGRIARRAALRRVAGAAGRRHPLLDADAAQRQIRRGTGREFTREGADITWFDEGKDTLTRRVRQIQTGIHWAEEPLSRIAHLLSNVQLLEATPDAATAQEVTAKCRFLDLPQPGRDRDRFPRRQARGHAAPGRGRLDDRPAQDHPRPERAADQEPDVFLLSRAVTVHRPRSIDPGIASDGTRSSSGHRSQVTEQGGTAMTMNGTRGYRPGLVDQRDGADQPRDLRQRRHLRAGAGARLRPLLAVRRPRKPDPQPRRFLRLADGRGVGDPVPRPRRRGPCVPQFVPPSRDEGVPLRRGQHHRLHLPLSRLELRHRRRAGRRAVFPRGLPFRARQGAMGPRRGGAAVPATRAPSGPIGTPPRRRSSNISANSAVFST